MQLTTHNQLQVCMRMPDGAEQSQLKFASLPSAAAKRLIEVRNKTFEVIRRHVHQPDMALRFAGHFIWMVQRQ